MSIINEINDIEELKNDYLIKKKLKINNFLNNVFVESLFKHIYLDKNWMLATGIDKNKYEKLSNQQNDKINTLQIKNVNNAFSKDQFTYIFYLTMYGVKMSPFEFFL